MEKRSNYVKRTLVLKKENTKNFIDHSDRGLQYCSDDYQKLLKKHKICCSITQESDPYEIVE